MPVVPHISSDSIRLHSELLLIESGVFNEAEQLAEKELLEEGDQMPPMSDVEVRFSFSTGYVG